MDPIYSSNPINNPTNISRTPNCPLYKAPAHFCFYPDSLTSPLAPLPMAMGCLAGCKKSLSWTDPLNHKKRADNFSARFLFSDSPQLYFPTTSLPELEPAAGNELPFPLSPPLSTHHSPLSEFPSLLLMTHPLLFQTKYLKTHNPQ